MLVFLPLKQDLDSNLLTKKGISLDHINRNSNSKFRNKLMSKDDISTLRQLSYCAVFKETTETVKMCANAKDLGWRYMGWDGGSVEGACGPRTQS